MRMIVPVALRALVQRNRKLSHDDQRPGTAGGWFSDLGDYCALGFKHNWIVKRHVEPEAQGRDRGAVKNYEQLLGSWSYPNT